MYASSGAGLGKAICERWTIGLLMLEEYYRGAHKAFHKFQCPMWIFTSHVPIDRDNLSPEEKTLLQQRDDITWDPQVNGGTLREIESWRYWTTQEVQVVGVPAAHDQIWFHVDTEIAIWRSFRELAEIDQRLEGM